jgi:hypothetical protein
VLLALLTTSADTTWFAATAGAGLSLPILGSRWRFDAFGEIAALRFNYYTYPGVGIGIGFHRTAASGFTIGFSLPAIGFATRLGHSLYGYDPSFRRNDSLGYFYLGSFAAMPLFTIGYRFACPCAR